ncbi:MAG: CBU_0592 family membrane protein, partial [Rubripirellula sp.]
CHVSDPIWSPSLAGGLISGVAQLTDIVLDLAGWLGAGLLLIFYWLLTSNRVNATDSRYHLGNFAGGSLLLFNNLHYGAYPSGFVNLVWLVIAALAVTRHVNSASSHQVAKTASVNRTAST